MVQYFHLWPVPNEPSKYYVQEQKVCTGTSWNTQCSDKEPVWGVQALRECEWRNSSACESWHKRWQNVRFRCRASAKIQQTLATQPQHSWPRLQTHEHFTQEQQRLWSVLKLWVAAHKQKHTCTQTKCIIIHWGTEKKFYISFLPYSLPPLWCQGYWPRLIYWDIMGKETLLEHEEQRMWADEFSTCMTDRFNQLKGTASPRSTKTN